MPKPIVATIQYVATAAGETIINMMAKHQLLITPFLFANDGKRKDNVIQQIKHRLTFAIFFL